MPGTRPVLNCPVCGLTMEVKPFPKEDGWTLSCYGRKPRPHRMRFFWTDPVLYDEVKGKPKKKRSSSLSEEIDAALEES